MDLPSSSRTLSHLLRVSRRFLGRSSVDRAQSQGMLPRTYEGRAP